MSQRHIRRALAILAGALGIIALYSSAAYASGPPVVTIGSVSNVSLNTVTVNGSVDPNGTGGTTYKVEYGKSKLYGSSTPVMKSNSSITVVPISQMVVGMDPLTTYHFRISATNTAGTTVSEDVAVEMLLSWKVGGTLVSKLGSPATYGPRVFGHDAYLEIDGTLLGGPVHFYCSSEISQPEGALGIEYNGYSFASCHSTVNGIHVEACDTGLEVFHLNANLAQSEPTTLSLSENCSLGKSLTLTEGGFAAPETQENVRFNRTLQGVTYINGKKWEMKLFPGDLALSGTYKGKLFGIL
ncbi:MAG TPA: fibronectin type III domain-containing protein [Solirubrobacterales bacterium]|nr:fibronectin type III domain-containing protein [Solirubrobacterales bacterium]